MLMYASTVPMSVKLFTNWHWRDSRFSERMISLYLKEQAPFYLDVADVFSSEEESILFITEESFSI